MKSEIGTLLKLWPYIKDRRIYLATIVFCGLVSSIVESFSFSLFAPLLISLEGGGNHGVPKVLSFLAPFADSAYDSTIFIVSLLIISIAVKNVIVYASVNLFTQLDSTMGDRVRTSTFNNIVTANPIYVASQPAGRLANALISETWRFSQLLGAFYTICVSALALIIFVTFLFLVSWKASAIILPVLVIFALLTHATSKLLKSSGQRSAKANAEFSRRSLEAIAGHSTIRLFGRRHSEMLRFAETSAAVRRNYHRLQMIGAAYGPSYEVVVAVVIGGLLLFLKDMHISFPAMAVFLIVLYRVQPHARNIAQARVTLHQCSHAALEIESLGSDCRDHMEYRQTDTDKIHADMPFDKVDIDIVDVTAGYGPVQILDRLSLHIAAGKITAIVGPSGAGKSSIVNLLTRAIKPQSGLIRCNSEPLDRISLEAWLNGISVVSQNTFLFDDTVAFNIGYGCQDASTNSIIDAAVKAGADDFIRGLPNGYNTVIGERGALLSGGQCQRIALARAILRKPALIILDEATNALDSKSEDVILDYVDSIRHETTVINIAHRISSVSNADIIYVINKGRVEETGTFTELRQRGGLFSQMAAMQSLGAVA